MSTMRKIDDLYQFSHAQLLDCPKALWFQTAVDKVREFCTETQWWTCKLDPINMKAGMQTYDVDGYPKYAELVRVLRVWIDGGELLAGHDYACDDYCTVTFPVEHTVDRRNSIQFEVALMPRLEGAAEESSLIPDSLFSRFHMAVSYGIMGTLMTMLGNPWSNPGLGQLHLQRYWDGINRAKLEILQARTNRPVQATAQWRFA